jgi:hypothetical protein
MDDSFLHQLKFPVGECPKFISIESHHIIEWLAQIEEFPFQIRMLTENLSDKQKQLVYRPNGWNIAQVVHHCADSHMNSFMRFKLALTEDKPTIRPYYEDRWAELEVGKDLDISDSLDFLDVLHYRWLKLIDSLNAKDLDRKFVHPANNEVLTLAENIGVYAWHCQHHLMHVQQALIHKGKF